MFFKRLYLIDFGLSKFYYNEDQGHIPPGRRDDIIGTRRYLSVNVLNHERASRRDDLISICYVLFELAIGHLPWNTSVWGKDFPNIRNDMEKSDAKKTEIKETYTGKDYRT